MTKLQYPKVNTYFIAWNDKRTEIQANGLVLTTQVMETLLIEIDYYINEDDYLSVLNSNNGS